MVAGPPGEQAVGVTGNRTGGDADLQMGARRFDEPDEGRQRGLTGAGLVGADDALGHAGPPSHFRLGQAGSLSGCAEKYARSLHAITIADRRCPPSLGRAAHFGAQP